MVDGSEESVKWRWRFAGRETSLCAGVETLRCSLVPFSSVSRDRSSYVRFLDDERAGEEEAEGAFGVDVVTKSILQFWRTQFEESLTNTIGNPRKLRMTGISPKRASVSGIRFCSKERHEYIHRS